MTDNLQEIMQIGGGDGRSGSDEEDEDLSDDYDEEGYFDEEGYYDGSDGEGSSGEDESGSGSSGEDEEDEYWYEEEEEEEEDEEEEEEERGGSTLRRRRGGTGDGGGRSGGSGGRVTLREGRRREGEAKYSDEDDDEEDEEEMMGETKKNRRRYRRSSTGLRPLRQESDQQASDSFDTSSARPTSFIGEEAMEESTERRTFSGIRDDIDGRSGRSGRSGGRSRVFTEQDREEMARRKKERRKKREAKKEEEDETFVLDIQPEEMLSALKEDAERDNARRTIGGRGEEENNDQENDGEDEDEEDEDEEDDNEENTAAGSGGRNVATEQRLAARRRKKERRRREKKNVETPFSNWFSSEPRERIVVEPEVLTCECLTIWYFYDQPGLQNSEVEIGAPPENRLVIHVYGDTVEIEKPLHGAAGTAATGRPRLEVISKPILTYGAWHDRVRASLLLHFSPFDFQDQAASFGTTKGKVRVPKVRTFFGVCWLLVAVGL